jgi:uncharacterized membrane protein YeaQ/YmgE (transglycosylase-associated protein family)
MAGHGIIGWLFIGLIVGVIAKWLTGERDAGGCLVTIAIGIAGSLFAGWVGSHLFHWYQDGSTPGWIVSILGAVALLTLYRMVANRR